MADTHHLLVLKSMMLDSDNERSCARLLPVLARTFPLSIHDHGTGAELLHSVFHLAVCRSYTCVLDALWAIAASDLRRRLLTVVPSELSLISTLPLIIAAGQGVPDSLLRKLLQYVTQVSTTEDTSIVEQEDGGCTALMEAARHGQHHKIDLLLKAHASITHLDADQQTAIDWAIVSGEWKTADQLLSNMSEPDRRAFVTSRVHDLRQSQLQPSYDSVAFYKLCRVLLHVSLCPIAELRLLLLQLNVLTLLKKCGDNATCECTAVGVQLVVAGLVLGSDGAQDACVLEFSTERVLLWVAEVLHSALHARLHTLAAAACLPLILMLSRTVTEADDLLRQWPQLTECPLPVWEALVTATHHQRQSLLYSDPRLRQAAFMSWATFDDRLRPAIEQLCKLNNTTRPNKPNTTQTTQQFCHCEHQHRMGQSSHQAINSKRQLAASLTQQRSRGPQQQQTVPVRALLADCGEAQHTFQWPTSLTDFDWQLFNRLFAQSKLGHPVNSCVVPSRLLPVAVAANLVDAEFCYPWHTLDDDIDPTDDERVSTYSDYLASEELDQDTEPVPLDQGNYWAHLSVPACSLSQSTLSVHAPKSYAQICEAEERGDGSCAMGPRGRPSCWSGTPLADTDGYAAQCSHWYSRYVQCLQHKMQSTVFLADHIEQHNTHTETDCMLLMNIRPTWTERERAQTDVDVDGVSVCSSVSEIHTCLPHVTTANATTLKDTHRPCPLLCALVHKAFPTQTEEHQVGPVVCERFVDQHQPLLNAVHTADQALQGSSADFSIKVPGGKEFQLGAGSFGGRMLLGLAEIKPRKHVVAVRELHRSDTTDFCVRRLQDFTRIRMRGTNLLGYREFIETKQHWLLARPVCDWNLDQFLAHSDTHPQSTILKLAWHMMQGLLYLHNCASTLFHGNLKPANLLIDSTLTLRLVDFGFGKLCTLSHGYNGMCYTDEHHSTLHPVCWKPPEYYDVSQPYTQRSDIHSAGSLLFYMLTGGQLHAFIGHDHTISARQLRDRVRLGQWVCLNENDCQLAAHLRHAIQLMLAVQPDQRPDPAHVLCWPMFWSEQQCLAVLLVAAAHLQQSETDPLHAQLHSLHGTLDSVHTTHLLNSQYNMCLQQSVDACVKVLYALHMEGVSDTELMRVCKAVLSAWPALLHVLYRWLLTHLHCSVDNLPHKLRAHAQSLRLK